MTVIGEAYVSLRPEMSGFASSVRSKLEAVLNPSGSSGLMGVANKVGLATIVGLVAATGAAADLGVKMQDAEVKIQQAMDTTKSHADAVANSFKSISDSTFDGEQVASQFAPVAGQLDLMAGHVLTVKQALDQMIISTQLADATDHNLNESTSALSQTMFAFHQNLGAAAGTANVLFNVSRDTNTAIGTVSTTVDKLHARLGILAPSLKQTAGLMAMPAVASLGARGVQMVSSALNHLLDQSTATASSIAKTTQTAQNAVTSAQTSLNNAQTAYAQKQAEIAQAGGAATLSQQDALTNASSKVAQETAKLTLAQQNLKAAQDGTSTSQAAGIAMMKQIGVEVFNSHHKYVGLKDIIGQLHSILPTLNNQQRQLALTTMFGTGAAQVMGQVIAGGVPAYNRAIGAVSKHNAMINAAKDYQQSLRGQLEIIVAQFKNWGTTIGSDVVPKLLMLVHGIAAVTGWLGHNKGAAIALAAVIGGVLLGSVIVYSVNLTTRLAASTRQAIGSLTGFGTQAEETAADTRWSMMELLNSIQMAVSGMAEQLGVASTETREVMGEMSASVASTAATSEAAAPSFDLLGAAMDALPVFALIAGITLLATHWKQVFPILKEVALAAWRGIDFAFHEIAHGIAIVVDWVREHWKLLPAIFLGPIGIIITIFLMFHKRITDALERVVKDALGLGKAIIMGVWHGIDNGYHDVLSGIKKIGEGILGAFKSVWHIFSPSADMHNMGRDLLRGLSNGIDANAHLATAAMGRIKLSTSGVEGRLGSGSNSSSAEQMLVIAMRQMVVLLEQQVTATRANTNQMKQPIKGTVKMAASGSTSGGAGGASTGAAISAGVGLR